MKSWTRCAMSALSAVFFAGAATAQDRADIDTTKIIGNRELPKVLTIVPWKKPLPGALTGKPMKSVLDDALAPIDREVLGRQISYGTQVQAQLQTQAQAQTPVPNKTTLVPAQNQGAATAPPPPESPANSPAPATGEKR